MANEVTSRSMMEHTQELYVHKTIETTHEIVVMVKHITATRVDQVALVTITLSFETEGKTSNGRLIYPDPDPTVTYLLNSLRLLIRKTDVVFLLGHAYYFLLLAANLQGGQIVQSRLWDALLWRIHSIHNTADGEILHPCSISSGCSAYPAPHQEIEEFIEAASDASLHSIFAPEKPPRAAKRVQTLQQEDARNEELPALARKLGIPYLSLLPRKPPECVQQLVDPRLAQELRCYPLGCERNMLTVAMLNPQDRLALDRLHQVTGMDIFPILTHPQELQTALEQLV